MNEKMSEWTAQWLTIPEFEHIVPVHLFHKEQETTGSENEKIADTLQNTHVLIRAHFYLEQDTEWLKLKITADDHYKLYFEEDFVAEGPACGYPEHYYYNEMILHHIKAGEHVFAIHAYYQGLVNRVYNSGDYKFAFAAELSDPDGKNIPLTFRYKKLSCYSGTATGYETQFLENFDSRKFPADWKKQDFEEAGWSMPVAAEWADYRLFLQPTKMLYHRKRKPDRIDIYDDGSMIVDAGEELTGALCLTASGRSGNKIEIFCGEELDEKGRVRYEMRCNCTYHETWILSGGRCELEPYDYKGFRYAMIKPQSGVKIEEIYFLERHYPMDDESCMINSSNHTLEQIFSICKNAVRLGTQDNYVDCPTREKGQYLGDAIVTAHAQVLLTGETEMLLKCIDQFAETSKVCPGLLAVAPGGLMQEIADFSLLYPKLLLLYYRYTGDKAVIKKYYGTVENIIRHFSQYEREDGLLEQVADKWNLVDWPENLRDGYDFPLTRPVVAAGCHNVINALYIGCMKMANRLAEIIGEEKQYDLSERIANFYKAFFRKETGLFADSETSMHSSLHANVYPLYFELAGEKDEKNIISFIEKKGFCCGVMLSYFVLHALAKKGQYEAVYKLLCNEGEHGWINMLREGATTCFEAWGKDQKWNTSLCHPWASAPVPVILEQIAGIRIDPDSREGFFFEPHIPENVDNFKSAIRMCGYQYTVIKKCGKIKMWREKYVVSERK